MMWLTSLFCHPSYLQYLRAYLHLPPEIVPATLKKANRPPPRSLPPRGGDRGGFRSERPEGGDRDGYRRAAGDKKTGPGADFKPEFVCFFPRIIAQLSSVTTLKVFSSLRVRRMRCALCASALRNCCCQDCSVCCLASFLFFFTVESVPYVHFTRPILLSSVPPQ